MEESVMWTAINTIGVFVFLGSATALLIIGITQFDRWLDRSEDRRDQEEFAKFREGSWR